MDEPRIVDVRASAHFYPVASPKQKNSFSSQLTLSILAASLGRVTSLGSVHSLRTGSEPCRGFIVLLCCFFLLFTFSQCENSATLNGDYFALLETGRSVCILCSAQFLHSSIQRSPVQLYATERDLHIISYSDERDLHIISYWDHDVR